MLKCNSCVRRHAASANGFCEEFTETPQIDSCGMYASSKPSEGTGSAVNEPTGVYIHIANVTNDTTRKTV